MKPLNLKDKPLFEKYFQQKRCELSAVSFTNIFIWRDFFDFNWELIDNHLCLFAENKIGCFLYLPPLGNGVSKTAIGRCFEIMDSKNLDKNISRVENVQAQDCQAYERLGFKIVAKGEDYLYRRNALVSLSGNKYKSKRAAVNFFLKNYDYEYLPFKKGYTGECLALYRKWQKDRQGRYSDPIYRQMLKDNFQAQKVAMENFSQLNLVGRIIRIKNKIKGYTFGFRLNKDTFCILFEVADLNIAGIANFLFREFCREMRGFSYINCMDDSGLENLKRTKLSFRPHRLIPAYIAFRE